MAFMHGAAIHAGPTNMSIWQSLSSLLLAGAWHHFRLESAMSSMCVLLISMLCSTCASNAMIDVQERDQFAAGYFWNCT